MTAKKPNTTIHTQALDADFFSFGGVDGGTIGLEVLTSFSSFFGGLEMASTCLIGSTALIASTLDEGLAEERGVISTKGRPKSVGSGHSRGVVSFVEMIVRRKYETNLKLGKAQPFVGLGLKFET
jgi:hypothetical protein